MRRRISYNGIVAFVSVIEAGSVTGGSQTLGASKSVVSRHLQDLERALQTSLLIRMGRKIMPTRAGEVFYRRCALGVETLEAAWRDMQAQGQSPAGELRVLADAAFGRYRVMPVLKQFAHDYPDCRLSVTLSDAARDFDDSRFDVAFRTLPLEEPSLRVRRIGAFEQRLVVGRQALARLGPFDHFERLKKVPFIGRVDSEGCAAWRLTKGEQRKDLKFHAKMSIEPLVLIVDEVLGGAGVSILPDYLYNHPDLAPRLAVIFPDWAAEIGSIYAYTFPSRQRAAAVKTLIETMVAAVRPRSAGFQQV